MPSPDLENWLKRATRGLARESVAKVRDEIGQHYELAREDETSAGLSAAEADRSAISALGDAKAANIRYRRVLLTRSDVSLLDRAEKESSFRWLTSEASLVVMALTVAFLATTVVSGLPIVWKYALPALVLEAGFVLFAVLLPFWTPSRAPFFRCARLVLQAAAFLMLSGPGALRMASVMFIWLRFGLREWQRAALRRKLPITQWPRGI